MPTQPSLAMAAGGLRGTLGAMLSNKDIYGSAQALGPAYEHPEQAMNDADGAVCVAARKRRTIRTTAETRAGSTTRAESSPALGFAREPFSLCVENLSVQSSSNTKMWFTLRLGSPARGDVGV